MNKYAIDYLTNEERRYMYIVESKLSKEDFERNIEDLFKIINIVTLEYLLVEK